jgi:hypothetical protein
MIDRAAMRFFCVVVLCGILFAGCGGAPHLRLVCVIDLSSSIEPDARAEAFAALQKLFAEHHLRRGDSVIIIPVTNDSMTEAQGHILRFEVSESRAAYDSDLKKLAEEVGRAINSLKSDSDARPTKHSDIIGAVKMALEEVNRERAKDDDKDDIMAVVLLSDFVHDTPSCNFGNSPQFVSEDAARRYAASLTEGGLRITQGTKVYMGLLRSSELRKIPQTRRDAIQAFWGEYLQRAGAASVSLSIDGPTQLVEATQVSR